MTRETRNVKLTSIELKPGQQEQLAMLALHFGFVVSRGAGAGQVGSVSQLMQAIAEGVITLEDKRKSI